MKVSLRTLLVVVLGLVITARLLTPGFPAQSQKRAKNFTDIDLEKIGVKPVQAKKDPKTSFIVGGKNPTTLIKRLTEINGRTIEALEKDMRPGPKSEVGSEKGFLGPDERLLEVLVEDNRYVVEELSLTHQELARHLHVVAGIGAKFNNQEFLYHGRPFKVTGMDLSSKGYQLSPFYDDTKTNQEATVHNLDNGKKIEYSLLVPHMIERYGFYEGKGTPYRLEPRKVLEVFDFLKKREKP